MSRSRPLAGRAGTRGEALPVAVLFLGVIFTVLVGMHVMAVAVARAAVRAGADAAAGAARVTAPGDRAGGGVLAARIALAAARSPVVETRLPAMAAEPERGRVRVLVFGGIISPVLGGAELSARAVPCGAGFDAGSHKRSPAAFGSSRHLASACAPGSSRTARPNFN